VRLGEREHALVPKHMSVDDDKCEGGAQVMRVRGHTDPRTRITRASFEDLNVGGLRKVFCGRIRLEARAPKCWRIVWQRQGLLSGGEG
jgi:hypothetical protein